MKKKGFTLIELLAVIIILAVVALIATPITLNIIDDVRKSAIERSAHGYYNAAEYVYGEMMLDRNLEDVTFTFENGIQTSSNPKYTLDLKGEKAKGGMVYLGSDGQILVNIHNGKYCATIGNDGTVSLSEDIESCTPSIIPEKCFYIQNDALSNHAMTIDGSEDWMNQNYNVLYYHYDDAECPTTFDTLTLPSQVGGEQVEVVSYETFQFDSHDFTIKNVIIPNGIKFVTDYAFGDDSGTYYLNIENVILPNSLIYIGEVAFSQNKLTNIAIPDSVTRIGNYAFHNNTLTSVTIGNSVAYIGDYAFLTNQLTSIIIPDNVTYIGYYAFASNQLTNVTISNSVTSIDAFADNQLTSVTIPSSVTSIGGMAFYNNQLTSVVIPNSVTSIGSYAFDNNQLTSVVIPNSVTSIGRFAFRNNSFPNASSITIEGDATRFDSNWTNIGFPAK